jgi:hypothetical protein
VRIYRSKDPLRFRSSKKEFYYERKKCREEVDVPTTPKPKGEAAKLRLSSFFGLRRRRLGKPSDFYS